MTSATALLITRDEELLEDVLRLTAAAGVELDVAHDSAAALRSWAAAPVVLVGADQLPAIGQQHPLRREQVHVISLTPAPDDLFRAALAIGAENVAELPAAETWLVELLTDVADGGARRATTIGVVGGSGGAGATTFAAALALTAARDTRQVLLIDADPFGGGIDRVAGFEDLDGIRWDSFAHTTGRFSSRSLREALPQRDGLAVLTWASGPHPRTEAIAVREVLSAAQRGSDTVVVDLPRYPDPMTTEVLSRCDHVVLVSGLTMPAVAAASRVAAYLHDSAGCLHLVTRGGATGLRAQDASVALGIPLVAAMTDQRRLVESVDLGLGPVQSRRGPLARAAAAMLDRVGRAPSRVA